MSKRPEDKSSEEEPSEDKPAKDEPPEEAKSPEKRESDVERAARFAREVSALAQSLGGAAQPKNEPPQPPSSRAPRWRLRLRVPTGFAARALLGTGCLLFIGLIWTLATRGKSEFRAVPANVLPSPEETFRSFHSLWFEKALTRNALASLWRLLKGFGLAALVGVPLGIAAGTWPRVNAFLAPISVFLRNVPMSAMVPITIVWFGIGERQKSMFIFVACVMFLVFDAARAVQGVQQRYLDTALTLGARPLQVLAKVLVPLSLPDIFASLRLVFGVGFGYIIVAEMINITDGLGALVITAQRRGPIEHVYLVLMFIALLAWGIDRGLRAVEKALFPYREDQ